MPIIALCGEDNFRLRERLAGLVDGFGKKYDPARLNILRAFGDAINCGEAIESLKSVGFLGSKRLVVIEGFFKSARAKEFMEMLGGKDVGENVLILTEPCARGDLAGNSVFIAIEGLGAKIEEFPLLQGPALLSWLKSEIKNLGGEIDKDALLLLEKTVGNDLWQMRQEIHKLCAFCRGRSIGAADIKLLTNAGSEEDIFEFLDALGRKDSKRAAQTLHREIDANGPQIMIAMLARQFRTLLFLEEKKSDGQETAAVIAKQIGAHPYAIKKSLALLPFFSKKELLKIWREIVNLDRTIKTGVRKPSVAFDLFLSGVIGKI